MIDKDIREAIFYIKELQKIYASMDKKVAKAVNMAIEALKEKLQLSEETITNGSYIRDGRLMHDLVYRGEAEVIGEYDHSKSVIENIKEGNGIPKEITIQGCESVKPKQLKGYWIYGNGNGECSICGREKSKGWDNYCGYCGARMRE